MIHKIKNFKNSIITSSHDVVSMIANTVRKVSFGFLKRKILSDQNSLFTMIWEIL
ncbi:hypothetical protein KSU1_C0887 [Candidatus Jettenia caeni]|uniref:Uncharacterized protein n=1 Tax=Candidatus Jettenia caeni TaxID=247490 RepID=I3IL88_9BACT|nr:hypothetical protein KSU1_C0887 [Candidatus Jettenia caeni]